MAMLEVKDLHVYYGMIQAIKGISFEVNQGETIALIGANGAGKTTTLHTVTGLLAPKKGNVIFEGQDITKIPAHKIVGLGMAHVPEGRRVFAQLSVYQNLKMGAYTRSNKTEIEETLEMVYRRFPRLEERKNQMAGTLSGGEQQMLAMGRALMSKPKIILLDEPSMGLSPILVNEIFDIIQALNEAGTTVLLVEQNAKKALAIADRAYVLETGRIVQSGRNYEKTQLSAGMKIDSASPAYKLIYDDNWQIVICPTADQYKRLKELDTVNLQLQRDNITVSADVSTFQKDGTDYVSFSLSNYMVRYCNDRYIDIEIIWDNHDGLKIPKSSIVSKNFYRIPADYLQTEEESSESGFYSVDNDETVFIKPVIYAQNKEYCYVDCADIAEGTVLKKPSSDETYTIGETEALKGVYNINKGYAMFRLIDILYEYGDYCIVSDKTDYGVTLYDHIILNGSSVKENEIIY